MLTFGITTTTKCASLSLHSGEKLLGEIRVDVPKTHSTTILEKIEKLFDWCGKDINEVENVIVSVGPGSFTGVRIAMAVIKAMFYGKNAKIYSVNELNALGFQAKYFAENAIALIDSNKEKIYYGIYKDGICQGEHKIGKLDDIIEMCKVCKEKNFLLIGDGAINYRKKLLENGIKINENDVFLKINAGIFPVMLREGMLEEVDLFVLKPNYLEKSQAERDKSRGN